MELYRYINNKDADIRALQRVFGRIAESCPKTANVAVKQLVEAFLVQLARLAIL